MVEQRDWGERLVILPAERRFRIIDEGEGIFDFCLLIFDLVSKHHATLASRPGPEGAPGCGPAQGGPRFHARA